MLERHERLWERRQKGSYPEVARGEGEWLWGDKLISKVECSLMDQLHHWKWERGRSVESDKEVSLGFSAGNINFPFPSVFRKWTLKLYCLLGLCSLLFLCSGSGTYHSMFMCLCVCDLLQLQSLLKCVCIAENTWVNCQAWEQQSAY